MLRKEREVSFSCISAYWPDFIGVSSHVGLFETYEVNMIAVRLSNSCNVRNFSAFFKRRTVMGEIMDSKTLVAVERKDSIEIKFLIPNDGDTKGLIVVERSDKYLLAYFHSCVGFLGKRLSHFVTLW